MEDCLAFLDSREMSEKDKAAFVRQLSAHWGVGEALASGPRKALEEARQLDTKVNDEKLNPTPPTAGKVGKMGQSFVGGMRNIIGGVAHAAEDVAAEVTKGVSDTVAAAEKFVHATVGTAIKSSMYVKVETVRLTTKAKDGITDVIQDVLLIKKYQKPCISSSAPISGYKEYTILSESAGSVLPYSIPQKEGKEVVITKATIAESSADEEVMIVLQYKQGAPTNDLCGGVYMKISDDCNGQPLYQKVKVSGSSKTKEARFLGYCGYIWTLNDNPNATMNGQAAGWHWSNEQNTVDLTKCTFANLEVLTDAAAVCSFIQDSQSFAGEHMILQTKPDGQNDANCSGVYQKIEDDCNGEPLYYNESADRYLGYCGFLWVVNNQPNETKAGNCTGSPNSQRNKHSIYLNFDDRCLFKPILRLYLRYESVRVQP